MGLLREWPRQPENPFGTIEPIFHRSRARDMLTCKQDAAAVHCNV